MSSDMFNNLKHLTAPSVGKAMLKNPQQVLPARLKKKNQSSTKAADTGCCYHFLKKAVPVNHKSLLESEKWHSFLSESQEWGSDLQLGQSSFELEVLTVCCLANITVQHYGEFAVVDLVVGTSGTLWP